MLIIVKPEFYRQFLNFLLFIVSPDSLLEFLLFKSFSFLNNMIWSWWNGTEGICDSSLRVWTQ